MAYNLIPLHKYFFSEGLILFVCDVCLVVRVWEKFQISWGPPVFSFIKASMTNHVNSVIADGKIICCMLIFLNFTWEFSLCEISVCSSVQWNSQKIVYYCLVITLWKWEYCLIWALNKSVLFDSNSLKLSVLCDMNSEKLFTIVWFGRNPMKMSVLLDINSGKVCSIVCQ